MTNFSPPVTSQESTFDPTHAELARWAFVAKKLRQQGYTRRLRLDEDQPVSGRPLATIFNPFDRWVYAAEAALGINGRTTLALGAPHPAAPPRRYLAARLAAARQLGFDAFLLSSCRFAPEKLRERFTVKAATVATFRNPKVKRAIERAIFRVAMPGSDLVKRHGEDLHSQLRFDAAVAITSYVAKTITMTPRYRNGEGARAVDFARWLHTLDITTADYLGVSKDLLYMRAGKHLGEVRSPFKMGKTARRIAAHEPESFERQMRDTLFVDDETLAKHGHDDRTLARLASQEIWMAAAIEHHRTLEEFTAMVLDRITSGDSAYVHNLCFPPLEVASLKAKLGDAWLQTPWAEEARRRYERLRKARQKLDIQAFARRFLEADE